MSKSIETWIEEDVSPFRDKSVRWLSQYHFFRDPCRPTYSDLSFFFAPADGILLYQREVGPDEAILDIKGRPYSLRDAMRQPDFDKRCLVIGTFMTFFDVHINRVPYPGRLSYRELDPIDTFNHPMLETERGILDLLRIPTETLEYLHHNQRVINRIDSYALGQPYYLLQIADYDVDCITPFELKQNRPVDQGSRFSMIRYGSQVDLVIPLSDRFEFEFLQPTGCHVEAGLDALVKVVAKQLTKTSPGGTAP